MLTFSYLGTFQHASQAVAFCLRSFRDESLSVGVIRDACC